MKKIKIVLLSLAISSFVACSSNDDTEEVVKDCVTCNAYDPVEGPTVPKREICKGVNGNAFIQGTDTTIEYNKYVEIQRRVTTCQ